MRIRFITIASTDRRCYVTGEEHDLPDAAAQDFMRAGHAVAVPPPQAPPAVPAPLPKPSPKPKTAAAV